MSDEWIEGRSLRFHRIEAGELPGDEEPPDDFVPRFLTPTGEFKPLTDEAISEIEALMSAHARGETPSDYDPQYEDSSGELQPITRQTLDELIEKARSQSWRRNHGRPSPRDLPPSWQTGLDLPPVPPEAAPPLPDAEEYVPWFDTMTGELPPIELEDEPGEDVGLNGEVVNAEWVEDLLTGEHPAAPVLSDLRAPGPVTRQLIEAVREGRFTGMMPPIEKRWRWPAILILLLVVMVGVVIVFVPGLLPGGNAPSEVPGEAGDLVETPEITARPTDAESVAPVDAATPTPEAPAYSYGRLAFASNRDGDFEIYVLDMVTGQLDQLTDNNAADRAPAWSPDGEQLLFVSDRSGDDDLFIMDADGSGQMQLTTSLSLDHAPAWSPDGEQVIFSREAVNGADLLAFYVGCMDEPGACEEALFTVTAGRYDLDPAWSPEGDVLAFASADMPGMLSVITLYDIAEESSSVLTETGSTDLYPAWSPDGAHLAFVSNNFGDHDLWIVGADGEGLVQVTQSVAGDVQPQWSPDGGYLLFASDRGDEGSFDLYLLDVVCVLDGGSGCEDELILLTDSPADDLDPAWLP